MCRNIHILYNIAPPTTTEEVDAAALQYVRKVSGMQRPSKANEEAFAEAVRSVARATSTLLDALVTAAPPRDRELEAARRRARAARRFGDVQTVAPAAVTKRSSGTSSSSPTSRASSRNV